MQKQSPNILFIMTDQHRADHVGWHPQARIKLPNLDRLAEGHTFLNCVSANPICTPARTALLTGRYTHQIGTLAMSGDLPRSIPTYAQALQKAGYHTAGIGKFHWLQTWKWGAQNGNGVDLAGLHEELKGYGFDEVWEATGKQLALQNRCDWCVQLEQKGVLEEYRRFAHASGSHFGAMIAQDANYTSEPWPFEEADYVDIATADRVLESLRTRPSDKPYFGFASFCGPHPPFDPPSRFLEMVDENPDEVFVCGAEDDVEMDVETTKTGFIATVAVPLKTLDWHPKSGQPIKGDFGYVFGNAAGTRSNRRAYLFNDSFTANVVDDIPHESRLEPANWGEVEVE
jgi:arylsulfatase